MQSFREEKHGKGKAVDLSPERSNTHISRQAAPAGVSKKGQSKLPRLSSPPSQSQAPRLDSMALFSSRQEPSARLQQPRFGQTRDDGRERERDPRDRRCASYSSSSSSSSMPAPRKK